MYPKHKNTLESQDIRGRKLIKLGPENWSETSKGTTKSPGNFLLSQKGDSFIPEPHARAFVTQITKALGIKDFIKGNFNVMAIDIMLGNAHYP